MNDQSHEMKEENSNDVYTNDYKDNYFPNGWENP